MAAWVKRIRKDHEGRLKKEQARYGEKAGSGITGRVLGLDGWEVAPSQANKKHKARPRAGRRAQIDAIIEAKVQYDVDRDMFEHEASILRMDLEIFVLSRRWRQKNRTAVKWFNGLTPDEQEAIIDSIKINQPLTLDAEPTEGTKP